MTSLLLDTGPFTMVLMDSPRLRQGVREIISEATALRVSAISFYEIGQKTRLGKWDEVADLVPELEALAEASGIDVVPLTASASLGASLLNWEHRDPFDRMIAAVALQEGVTVVSQDVVFETIGVVRVW